MPDDGEVNDFFIDKVKLPTSVVSNFGSYDTSKPFIDNYFNVIGNSEISTGDGVLDNLKSNRTLEVLPYKKRSSDNNTYFDYSKFVVTNSGQVYRDLSYNPDFDFYSEIRL